jgi:hypothetical protein
VKQVFERAEGRRRECREGLCRRGQIGPIGRNQRLTAVRQDEHEQPSTFAVQRPQKVERLAFERMARTDDGDLFREVLMMGSVSWFPSIRFPTSGCASSCSIAWPTTGYSGSSRNG